MKIFAQKVNERTLRMRIVKYYWRFHVAACHQRSSRLSQLDRLTTVRLSLGNERTSRMRIKKYLLKILHCHVHVVACQQRSSWLSQLDWMTTVRLSLGNERTSRMRIDKYFLKILPYYVHVDACYQWSPWVSQLDRLITVPLSLMTECDDSWDQVEKMTVTLMQQTERQELYSYVPVFVTTCRLTFSIVHVSKLSGSKNSFIFISNVINISF